MRSVFDWLETFPKFAGIPKDSIAYISVGGANGSELAAAFSRKEVQYGILLEFDQDIVRNFPRSLHLSSQLQDKIEASMQARKLKIFTGDAWARRFEVNRLLQHTVRAPRTSDPGNGSGLLAPEIPLLAL